MGFWKNKILPAALALGMICSTSVPAFAAMVEMTLHYNGAAHSYKAEEVHITINGKAFTDTDMPAVIINDRTMLPVGAIARELGAEVEWNDTAREVYITKGDTKIIFKIDSTTAFVNTNTLFMDVAPMIINDRTMIPVAALAESLDQSVTWVDASRTVVIESKQSTQSVTKLTGLGLPSSAADTQVFTIQANGKITNYEELDLTDDKIVLDIYGVQNGLAATTSATNSAIVTAVRTAYHADGDYTRVVFDLVGKTDYTVERSEDKTKLTISFGNNVLEDIRVRATSTTDVITLYGESALGATVTKTNEGLLVEIPNASAEVDEVDCDDLQFIDRIYVEPTGLNSLRVYLDSSEFLEYETESDGEEFVIRVTASSVQNMSYDTKNEVLKLEKVADMNIDRIAYNDYYQKGYYELTLPADYENDYGFGTWKINSDRVASLILDSSSGKTVLRFEQNQASVYQVEEDSKYYYIYVQDPRDVYDAVVVIDAGHGGNDPGTIANGLQEATLNLNVALKVQEILEDETDIKVYMTREDTTYMENKDRAYLANGCADLFVAIHMNSAENILANGTETWYWNHSSDPGELTSKQAAQVIQNYLVSYLGSTNRGLKESSNLIVLNSTTVPAVLVELGFVSNLGEALKLSTDAYQQKAAEAIADAIVEIFEDYEYR